MQKFPWPGSQEAWALPAPVTRGSCPVPVPSTLRIPSTERVCQLTLHSPFLAQRFPLSSTGLGTRSQVEAQSTAPAGQGFDLRCRDLPGDCLPRALPWLTYSTQWAKQNTASFFVLFPPVSGAAPCRQVEETCKRAPRALGF